MKKIVHLITLLLATNAFAANDGVEFAGDAVNNGNANSTASMVISPSDFSGTDSIANGNNSIIFGGGSSTDISSIYSAMIGSFNVATNSPYSVLFGYSNRATGPNAVVLGSGALAGDNAIAIGSLTSSSGRISIAIGQAATASALRAVSIGQAARSTGENNVAIGYRATAITGSTSTGNNTAIGANSFVGAVENSIALGSSSQAFESNVLSIGSDTIKRRIINMSDGVAATDGATVGQVGTLATAAANTAVQAAAPTIVNEAVTTSNSYTDQEVATTLSSSYDYTDQAIANLDVDTSNLLLINGERAMIGNLNLDSHKITNLRDGTEAQDATTLSQMQTADTQTLTAANTYANNLVYQTNGVETSRLSVAADSASLMVTNNIGNSHGIEIGSDKTVISGGTTSTSLTLDDEGATFATIADGSPARVRGVADGVDNNDAVNVGQLNAALANFTGGGNFEADIDRLEGKINKVSKELRKYARRSYGGTALAMSMISVPPNPYSAASFSVGTGMFNGEGAMSANLLLKDIDSDAVISMGIGMTTAGDVGIRAAVTWQWNPTLNDESGI